MASDWKLLVILSSWHFYTLIRLTRLPRLISLAHQGTELLFLPVQEQNLLYALGNRTWVSSCPDYKLHCIQKLNIIYSWCDLLPDTAWQSKWALDNPILLPQGFGQQYMTVHDCIPVRPFPLHAKWHIHVQVLQGLTFCFISSLVSSWIYPNVFSKTSLNTFWRENNQWRVVYTRDQRQLCENDTVIL